MPALRTNTSERVGRAEHTRVTGFIRKLPAPVPGHSPLAVWGPPGSSPGPVSFCCWRRWQWGWAWRRLWPLFVAHAPIDAYALLPGVGVTWRRVEGNWSGW